MKHIDRRDFTKAEASLRVKQIKRQGYKAKAVKQRKVYKVEYWT